MHVHVHVHVHLLKGDEAPRLCSRKEGLPELCARGQSKAAAAARVGDERVTASILRGIDRPK